jgi:heavy metal sensor kinase
VKQLASLAPRVGVILHSIRFRLVAWFTAILAVILLVFSAFIYYNQSRDLHADELRDMETKANGLTQLVRGALRLGSDNITIPKELLRESDVLVLMSPNGQVLASLGPISPQQAIQIVTAGLNLNPRAADSLIYWESSSHQHYVFAALPVEERGVSSLLIFGSLLDPNEANTRLLFTLAVGSLLTLAIALIGGYWLADRAMRPVKTITQAARTISETDLSHRLNLNSRDELGELANTFDEMLARLQAAFERQRQFVADASHELRTPLTIVNLETSRALAAKRSEQEYQRTLDIIRSENDFMSHLVNDLLMLARMDGGQVMMDRNPVDLSDVAIDAVERLEPLAARNGVRLETGDLPEVRILGDRQFLLQMISNLIENGIKYTTGTDKRVRIETGSTENEAWLRVSDNGPGIPAEHIPHLFDRFYRVDAARTHQPQTDPDPQAPTGSGLGLSIVHWLAQAHGGQINVSSVPDAGTTFEIRFPAISQQDRV